MITIDPPIEALTDAEKIDLIERLEASLQENWTPPQSHLDLLNERESLEQSGAMEILDIDELERRVMEAKL